MRVGFCLIVLSLLTGCASILSESRYPVSISSDPGGAEFMIVNRSGKTIHTGKTPSIVNLEAGAGYFRGEDYTVAFKKENFTSFTARIRRKLDNWYFGNIFFGGLIGMLIVDPVTGAMWELEDLHMSMSQLYGSIPDLKSRFVHYFDY